MRYYTVHVRGGRPQRQAVRAPTMQMGSPPESPDANGRPVAAPDSVLPDSVVPGSPDIPLPAGPFPRSDTAVTGRPGRLPVLVREGFNWGAALFGPVWLAAHGAWLAAVVDGVLWVLAAWLLPLAIPALVLLQGLLGQDIRRWSLRRRGAVQAGVVVASGREAAMVRLLDARPEWRMAGPRTGSWVRGV